MDSIISEFTDTPNHHSQMFFATLLQHTQDAIYVRDMAGRIVYWNQGAETLYGFTAEEARQQASEELMQTASAEDMESVALIIERAGQWEGELKQTAKDGRFLIVHSRQVLFRDQGQQLILAADRDLTPQKQAEQKYMASIEREANLRAAVEQERIRTETILVSINDHFVLYDQQWRFIYVNDQAAQMLRRPKEELLGQCIWELFPEAVGNRYYQELQRAMMERRNCNFEHYYQPWDRWFENRIYIVPEGLAVYATDITERKQTEEALRESEERFRLLVQHSAHIIWRTDAAGNFIGQQESWERFTGQRFADYQDFGGFNAIHPEDRKEVALCWQEALANLLPFQAEYRLRDRNGEYRHVLSRGIPMLDAVGRVKEWVGYIEDISERKRTEERYRGLFTSMQEGLLLAELIEDGPNGLIDFRYLEMNPAAEQILGISRDQVVGKTAREIIPNVREDLLKMYAEVVRTGEPIRSEVFEPMVNQYHENFGFRPASGQVAVLFWDITERKQIEEALRASEAREHSRAEELATLMEAVPAIVFIAHDPAATVITGSRAAREVLKMRPNENLSVTAPEEERPTHFKVFKDGIEVPREELPIQLAARGIEVRDYEEEVRFDDGTAINLLGNAVPLRDQTGQLRGSMGAFVDITTRKRLEASLREADRRKDEFLAMLAHELRNPLAPIRNAVEILERDGLSVSQFTQMRDIIARQTEHLARLVDDLLEVSRITQGRIILRKESVELLNIIGRAVETSRPLIDARNHEFTVTLPTEPVRLTGDYIRLAQVISNLLNNAAKYTDEGGEIQLLVELEKDQIRLCVRDNGAGIPPEELPYIFDLFTQTGRSLDRAQGGLGIGLTLVRWIVEMHGGRVEAYSAGVGQGSEFTVYLPVLSPPSQATVPPAAALAETSVAASVAACCRILVVDDNVDSADSLTMLLKYDGHQVQVAHDGPEALALALTFRPQIVILDIGLPGMNGYEVGRRLRREPGGEQIALIALTGYGQAEDRKRSKEAGFDHHLTKPVDYDVLTALLDSLMLK
jgi:PAS domain S-box-containing protein